MYKSLLILCLILPVLSACDKMSDMVNPKPVYYGLDRNSYGPLSKKPIHNCNPDTIEAGVDLQRGVESELYSSTITPDATIENEHLKDKFSVPASICMQTLNAGGVTNFLPLSSRVCPNVAMLQLGNKDKRAIFWYNYGIVKFDEVQNAAKEYCIRHEAHAVVYEGSATKCGPVTTVTSKGKSIGIGKPTTDSTSTTTDQPTYVISSFKCIGKSFKKSKHHSEENKKPETVSTPPVS